MESVLPCLRPGLRIFSPGERESLAGAASRRTAGQLGWRKPLHDSAAVRFREFTVDGLCRMPLARLATEIENWKLDTREQKIAGELLREITNRVQFLNDVGLNYLTVSRTAASLSNGEAQRIRLASQVGSELTGVIYILDEPSIGLHQRDNQRQVDEGIRAAACQFAQGRQANSHIHPNCVGW